MLNIAPVTEFGLGKLIFQVWGVCAALGFLVALAVTLRRARRRGMDEGLAWDLMLVLLFGMIVGGRLAYFCLAKDRGLGVLLDPHGGFVLMGGLVLSTCLAALYLGLRGKAGDLLSWADLLVPGALGALISVRLGCLLVGDHVGRVTALVWAVPYADGSLRHPVALYHMLALSILSVYVVRAERKERRQGGLFILAVLGYSALIFFVDFARCDDLLGCDPRFFGLTVTQGLLLVLVAVAFRLRRAL